MISHQRHGKPYGAFFLIGSGIYSFVKCGVPIVRLAKPDANCLAKMEICEHSYNNERAKT